MSILRWSCIPMVLLALSGYGGSSLAQGRPLVEQLQSHAEASFRQGRYSEAYGRFVALADAGHAPAAATALWMYANGPTLFDKDWDCTPDQLAAWARLAQQPVPVMVARSYLQPLRVATVARR